jgi:chemotaxis protein methyltransferase CheR
MPKVGHPACMDSGAFQSVPGHIGPGRKVNVKLSIGDSTFPELSEISDYDLATIGMILNEGRGFDLSVYKEKCMKRRVAIRIRSTGCSNVADYCDFLRRSFRELELLQKTLTIHVSQFFRNPSMFEKLRNEIIPKLFASSPDKDSEPLRFWCLGCAGGEEPYSLAILLREYFSREIHKVRPTIMATDIDAETLKVAHLGEYNEDRLKELPDVLRERYFRQENRRFCLVPEIREMVTFRMADISDVEQYIPSSLVLCRNTLIYFTRTNQEKILNGIADILQPGGILVLGKSESLIGNSNRRFRPVCQLERIYQRV